MKEKNLLNKINKSKKIHNVRTLDCYCYCQCGQESTSAGVFDRYSNQHGA